jgi:hypothetical protein
MGAACYFETYLPTMLHSHDNRQVEGHLQYVAIMLVRAKEIRLERRKQNKQILDIYLIPPISEIHNLIQPINV